MSDNSHSRIGSRRVAGFLIGIVVFAVILLFKPGDMSREAGIVAAMTALMASWWIGEAMPIGITALIPLIVLPIGGVTSAGKASAPYADHNIFLFLGGFFIALAMQKHNLHRRIALNIISRVGVRPRRIVLGFMMATAFVSMWMSNTATTLMMLPIALALLNSIRLDGADEIEHNKLGTCLSLGIAYAASIGGMGTLVGTPPNIIFAKLAHDAVPGFEPSFLNWMFAAMPFVIIFLPLTWFLMVRVLFPLSTDGGEGMADIIEKESAQLGPMSAGERRTFVVFAITALLWITRAGIRAGGVDIPGWAGLFGNPEYIQDSTVAIVMSVLLFLIPADLKKGEFLLDLEWALRAPWDVILLLGGGFALANAVDISGLGGWIGTKMQVICHLNVFVMVGIVSTTLIFLTEVMSNTAVTALFLPILAGAAAKAGVNPLLFMIPATLGASCAFMLPSGTPPNAIVFSTGGVTLPQMARTGLLLNIFACIILTIMIPTLILPILGVSIRP